MEVTKKLSDQFTRHLAETQAALEKKFSKHIKKNQSKVDRIWDFFTRHQVGTSSTISPASSQFEELSDEDEDDDTPNLDNDSHA